MNTRSRESIIAATRARHEQRVRAGRNDDAVASPETIEWATSVELRVAQARANGKKKGRRRNSDGDNSIFTPALPPSWATPAPADQAADVIVPVETASPEPAPAPTYAGPSAAEAMIDLLVALEAVPVTDGASDA